MKILNSKFIKRQYYINCFWKNVVGINFVIKILLAILTVVANKNNDKKGIVYFLIVFIISILEITIVCCKGNSVFKKKNAYTYIYSRNTIRKANFSLVLLYIMSVNYLYHAVMDIKNLDINTFFDKYLWIWMGLLLCMCFIKSVFLDSIVIFLPESYYSGGDFISYNTITKIETIEEKVISNKKLVLLHLFNKEKTIGFDKLFEDEYLFLINKISRNLQLPLP